MRKYLLLMLFLFVNANAFNITGLKNFNKYDMLYIKHYNRYFKLYTAYYTYNIVKAQSVQESLLNPTAKSYAGAYGLMQLMPTTYKWLQTIKHIKGTIANPKTNVELGIYYDARIFAYYKKKGIKNITTRFKYTFGGYNAGSGNINKAQKYCKNKDWNCIINHLRYITGKSNASQTTIYVHNIFKYYKQLEATHTALYNTMYIYTPLLQRQKNFAEDVGKLLTKIYSTNYSVTFGETYRTKHQQSYYVSHGLSKTYNSRHLKRLAIDLNLFNGKTFITKCNQYAQFGNYFETLRYGNKWGGNYKHFKDCPHFENNVKHN